MRSMFITLESCRNAYDTLMRHIGGWLVEVLKYEDPVGADFQAVYFCLGVDDDEWMALMMEVQPRFSDGRLLVSSSLKDREDTPGVVTMLLMKLLEFRRWSDSRWLSIGRSCRSLVLSLMLGLDNLIQYSLRQKGTSSYYLGGFPTHCCAEVKRMSAVIAMSSFGCDDGLRLLLEDDRLPVVLPQLDNELQAAMRFVTEVSPTSWQVIAKAVDMEPAELRHAAISASLTGAGYLLGQVRGPNML